MNIISFSSTSRTPSSSLTSTIVFNSSSVINGSLLFKSPPNNLTIRDDTEENNQTRGLKTVTTIFIIGATAKETFSAFCLAKDLGVISPKINTSIVITPVAKATPPSPNILKASVDANDDAPILTILFPIKIPPNNLLGSSNNFSNNLAPFISSSTICLTLILLKAIKAVSEAEKNPDKIIKIIRSTI